MPVRVASGPPFSCSGTPFAGSPSQQGYAVCGRFFGSVCPASSTGRSRQAFGHQRHQGVHWQVGVVVAYRGILGTLLSLRGLQPFGPSLEVDREQGFDYFEYVLFGGAVGRYGGPRTVQPGRMPFAADRASSLEMAVSRLLSGASARRALAPSSRLVSRLFCRTVNSYGACRQEVPSHDQREPVV